jgi:hypothetical protein
MIRNRVNSHHNMILKQAKRNFSHKNKKLVSQLHIPQYSVKLKENNSKKSVSVLLIVIYLDIN